MATIQFKGKSAVWNHHLSVPYHTLEKDDKKSLKGTDADENLIIEGDNLLALKSLLPKYQGKIKCIYIDPPYNTGNENWVYSDNVSSPLIKEWLNKEVGKDDLTRHDKWLCMMTPRLKLLRDLLKDEGVIFISINDYEVHRLRMLLDEVFGENCFIGMVTWKARVKPVNIGEAKLRPQKEAEYVLIYEKNEGKAQFKPLILGAERSYPHQIRGRKYRLATILKSNRGANRRENMASEINGYKPPEGQRWQAGKLEIQRLFDEEYIEFRDKTPFRRYFADEESPEHDPFYCYMDQELSGTSEEGKLELNELVGSDHGFDTVKPVTLIKTLIRSITSSDKNELILDSFAGSGTSAQAILMLNQEDEGNRKFLLVEMEDYANSLTAERVRRVIEKEKMQTGFTYHQLGPSIDAETLLSGKLPTYKQFAKYVFYLVTGRNHPDEKSIKEQDFFAGKIDHMTVYLIYEQNMESLKKLAVTLNWAQKTHQKDMGKKIVYAPACYLDDESLEQYKISFVSIPYNLFESRP